jgi:hypothetical protein
VSAEFGKKWGVLEERLKIVSGKEVLRQFRKRIKEDIGLTLTDAVLVGALRTEELPSDLLVLLNTLRDFISAL